MTEKKTEEVALSEEQEQTITKFQNFNSIEEQLQYAAVLIKSGLVPDELKKPEQVVTVINQGKELGFGPLTSLNNVHNIKGKATLSVHAITGLIKQAGVTYKLIEDAVWITEIGEAHKVKLPETKYIDRRTTIRFYEFFGDKIIENDISFTLSEAKSQELLGKKNWKKMPIIMLRTRTLTIGGRFVAPQALLGMYETSEAADFSNEDVLLDKEGNVITYGKDINS